MLSGAASLLCSPALLFLLTRKLVDYFIIVFPANFADVEKMFRNTVSSEPEETKNNKSFF